jgi:HK97 gp10 family phage protein
MKITGLAKVLNNFGKLNKLIDKGAEKGLLRGGALILKESMKQAPVDKSNLKPSAFTRNNGGSGAKADVVVGYTSDYAVYVHENTDAAHGEDFNKKHKKQISKGTTHTRGKGQKSKFLEDPVKENTNEVRNIVKKSIQEEMMKI